MKTRTPNQVLNEIAQEHIRHDIDLSSGILAKIGKERYQMKKSRVILTAVLAFALLLVVTFSIPGVVQAMQRLLGYVPGSGFVDQSHPLRILKEPGQTAHEGTTVTVKQAVADSEHTVVVYQVENISAAFIPQSEAIEAVCHKDPLLRLPDGSQLQGRVDTSNFWVSGYDQHVTFPPLPENVDSVVFVLPCLEEMSISTGDLKWEIPLTFVNAPPQMTAYPLVDLPTPTALSETQTSDQGNALPNSSEISLSLSKYVQTGDNILLFGALKNQAANINTMYVDDSAVHLRDASGVDIPLVSDPSLSDPAAKNDSGQSRSLIYQSGGKYSPGKATFTVDYVWVNLNASVQFSIDTGSSVMPDQVFPINKTVEVASHSVYVESARVNKSGKGLSFDLEKPEDVSEITLMDLEHLLLGGGGGENNYGFTYQGDFPAGVINVTLTSLTVKVMGPWQTTVDLPAFLNSSSPTSTPDACLTQASWQAALKNKISTLPAGLTGRLALATLQEPDYLYRVGTITLQNSQKKIFTLGSDPALSPDSHQLIYSSEEGLKRIDLSSGVTTQLLDTHNRDSGAIWSPDGNKIAFTRGPATGRNGAPGPRSLLLANPDGSNQQPLLENADANIAQAWLPDGKGLLYTVKESDGASVRSIDVATGHVTQLFEINYVNASVALSPDGKRVAYEAMLPGDHYAVYVANLDGSNPKLIANASPVVATSPVWSPDGQWLILSVQDETLTTEAQMPVLTLINVNSCQVIPLKNLTGYVSTWNP